MLSSYEVTCPHEGCGWSGSLVPSLLRGGPDAEVALMQPAWFRCPRCRRDWEVRLSEDRMTVLPAAVQGGPPDVPAGAGITADWRRLAKALALAGGRIDEGEVAVLRRELFTDGQIGGRGLEFLLELKRAAPSAAPALDTLIEDCKGPAAADPGGADAGPAD
jgi:hypothetical protein